MKTETLTVSRERKTRNKPNKYNRTGEKFITNEGYEIEIIEYFNHDNCTVRINDKYKTIFKKRSYTDIIKKNIKNPFHPSVFGIGYLGVGEYNSMNKDIYKRWTAMLRRCYDDTFIFYKDVTVCEEWKCFQNFAKWYSKNHKNYMEGWQLDKDILCKNCKIYSPKTCTFVPQEINLLISPRKNGRGKYMIGVYFDKVRQSYTACISIQGKYNFLGRFKTELEAFNAYKTAKEKYVKEIAEKYKNKITKKIYNKLINFKVNETD